MWSVLANAVESNVIRRAGEKSNEESASGRDWTYRLRKDLNDAITCWRKIAISDISFIRLATTV